MKMIRAAFALPILTMSLASMPAMAQDHPDNHTSSDRVAAPPSA
jgi:hypothetical protein